MPNSSKTQFLGMDHGTASHRLQRAIIWSLIERCGLNSCYRCDRPMSVSTYSIDHMQVWEGVSVALFWDVGNIAFSHLTCNVGARRRTGKPQRIPDGVVVPEGWRWCPKCEQVRKHEEFYPKSGGLFYSYCRPCSKTDWSTRRDKRREDAKVPLSKSP